MFLELFEPIKKGDFGLTDEAIYKSIQSGKPFIPIWGGNRTHLFPERLVSVNGKTKSGNSITVFDGEGIIISLDGSAGSMTYKKGQKFALNHHAGFFKVRDDAKNKILPEFFVHFYDTQLKNESVSEGSKTLTLDQIYNIHFHIPDIRVQEEVLLRIRPLLEKKEFIKKILQKIYSIKSKILSSHHTKFQTKNIPIKQIIHYLSGNSGLTEEFIYKKSQHTRGEYDVLASSEEHRVIGKIPMCKINGRSLKVFEDKDGLLVIRKGKAGNTRFLNKGKYTINDDAYILYVKESSPYKVHLKWLNIQYKNEFLSYSSSSDNGTWNMTGFFENVIIDIPEYDVQIEIIKDYDRLEWYEAKIQEIIASINELKEKSIAPA